MSFAFEPVPILSWAMFLHRSGLLSGHNPMDDNHVGLHCANPIYSGWPFIRRNPFHGSALLGLTPLEHPDRFEVCYVSANGGIRWHHDWVNVSSVCAGEYVGLEEIDDGLWNVYFGILRLGRFHERHLRIEDAYGRLSRHKV